MDRLQPLLTNYFTEGATWKEPGVTLDRVIARNKLIGLASPQLWAYAEGLIRDATRRARIPTLSEHRPTVTFVFSEPARLVAA